MNLNNISLNYSNYLNYLIIRITELFELSNYSNYQIIRITELVIIPELLE